MKRHDIEVAFIGASHCRLDAAIGQEGADRRGADSLAAQGKIEIGAGKGIEAALARRRNPQAAASGHRQFSAPHAFSRKNRYQPDITGSACDR
jgi:hypothetical protein